MYACKFWVLFACGILHMFSCNLTRDSREFLLHERVLRGRAIARCPVRLRHHLQVMVAFRNADRYEECLACWRELVLLDGLGDVTVNPKTFNFVLRVVIKAQQWEEMEVILDMMQVISVRSVFSVYLNSRPAVDRHSSTIIWF